MLGYSSVNISTCISGIRKDEVLPLFRSKASRELFTDNRVRYPFELLILLSQQQAGRSQDLLRDKDAGLQHEVQSRLFAKLFVQKKPGHATDPADLVPMPGATLRWCT